MDKWLAQHQGERLDAIPAAAMGDELGSNGTAPVPDSSDGGAEHYVLPGAIPVRQDVCNWVYPHSAARSPHESTRSAAARLKPAGSRAQMFVPVLAKYYMDIGFVAKDAEMGPWFDPKGATTGPAEPAGTKEPCARARRALQAWEEPYKEVLPGFHFWSEWLQQQCAAAPPGMQNCFMSGPRAISGRPCDAIVATALTLRAPRRVSLAGGGGWLFMETSQALVRTGFLSMSVSLCLALGRDALASPLARPRARWAAGAAGVDGQPGGDGFGHTVHRLRGGDVHRHHGAAWVDPGRHRERLHDHPGSAARRAATAHMHYLPRCRPPLRDALTERSADDGVQVGMSVDYVVHVAGAYVAARDFSRRDRVRYALYNMGTSVVSGAITTGS
eukprot:scaffold2145_cov309-Prasinococcus_capsulatus_cf.AAC.8